MMEEEVDAWRESKTKAKQKLLRLAEEMSQP